MSNFGPWIGAKYQAGVSGKRVLALGESHYCANKSDVRPTLTKEVIADLLDPESEHEAYKNTYTKFAKALVGYEGLKAREECYPRIAFYNFVQQPMSEAREAPTVREWDEARPLFLQLLEELHPERVIVWGYRLYDQLPDQGYELPELEVGGERYSRWCYELANGKKVECLRMMHPASSYSPEQWHKVIAAFLKD